MKVDINSLDAIRDMAVRDVQQRIIEDHIEHVIDSAGLTLTVEAFDTDALVDGLHELDHAGYAIDESDEDYTPPLLFCHPSVYYGLQDILAAEYRYFRDDPLRIYGVECYNDVTLPENVALLIHPYATVPTHPANYERPWDVRDPDGVIVYRTVGVADE